MKYEITLPALIEKAGKIIGTHNSLHSIACIDIALDHAMSLRDEIYQLRQKFAAIELKHLVISQVIQTKEDNTIYTLCIENIVPTAGGLVIYVK